MQHVLNDCVIYDDRMLIVRVTRAYQLIQVHSTSEISVWAGCQLQYLQNANTSETAQAASVQIITCYKQTGRETALSIHRNCGYCAKYTKLRKQKRSGSR